MMNIERKPFGKTARGEAVTLFEIRTPELTARILDYGATVQALLVPDKNGKPVDVVLGHDTIEGYETHDGYLGACVGRVANRLGGAQFTLNGKTYILAKNDGKNHLHGGLRGFDKYVWDAEVLEDGVKFSRVSLDGEEGYPGTLRVSVSYRVANGALTITYDAVSDQDTLCNLTNHSYFNLNGGGTALPIRCRSMPTASPKTATSACRRVKFCRLTGRRLTSVRRSRSGAISGRTMCSFETAAATTTISVWQIPERFCRQRFSPARKAALRCAFRRQCPACSSMRQTSSDPGRARAARCMKSAMRCALRRSSIRTRCSVRRSASRSSKQASDTIRSRCMPFPTNKQMK